MRKLLFSFVILLVMLLAAEVGITLLSQHGMEKALSSQYDLPPTLEVSINSFPYLLSLARNHINEVQLRWRSELPYSTGDAAAGSIDYEGTVNLYDVELSMPSLFTGKLEIRDISRQKAAITMDLEAFNKVLEVYGVTLTLEDGSLFLAYGDKKARCRVKVIGDSSLTIVPYGASTDGTGSYPNPDFQLETVELNGLPLGSSLLNASIKEEGVVLEISIPMWEGFL